MKIAKKALNGFVDGLAKGFLRNAPIPALYRAEMSLHQDLETQAFVTTTVFTWSGRHYSSRRPFALSMDDFRMEIASFIKRRTDEDRSCFASQH
jgi:hypothetical protein